MLGVNFDVLVDEIDVMRVCDGYRLYDGQDYLCFVERRDDGKCVCLNSDGEEMQNAALIFSLAELVYEFVNLKR